MDGQAHPCGTGGTEIKDTFNHDSCLYTRYLQLTNIYQNLQVYH